MNAFKFPPRLRLIISRLGSLLLLLQRTPVVQMLFPQANFIGNASIANSVTLAITTVVGLGAFDSVAGATAVVQKTPVANSTTVNATQGGLMTNFVYGITTGDSVGSYQITAGSLPTGLTKSPTISNKTNYIYGTPSVSGTFTITIKAWENSNNSGRSTTGTFNIIVAPPVSTPAAIATHPASTTINSGSTTTLSVTASGTAPFTYQWYQGASGTTTSPVGTSASTFTTPTLSATTNYWVKVSNAAKPTGANSNTSTVTVNQPAAIASHPASVSINSGSTTTLSVTASGTAPFTYQWYQGASGTTTTPVGTGTATFTTPVLNATTSYWVKVTNAAKPTGTNSNTATVTVSVPAGIASHPTSATIDSGGSSVLIVSPSGTAPFVYQWYQGPSGTTTTPVGGDSDIFMTPTLTATTSYWVKITNAANPAGANSNAAVITVRGGFNAWASALPAGQNGPLQTPQNDGVSNLLKYAFNLDPTKADTRRLTVGTGGTAGLPGTAVVNGRLRIEYIRRKASTSPGVSYTAQCGANLTTWEMTHTAETVTAIGATEWERVVVDGPLGETKCYGRVVVTQVP